MTLALKKALKEDMETLVKQTMEGGCMDSHHTYFSAIGQYSILKSIIDDDYLNEGETDENQ